VVLCKRLHCYDEKDENQIYLIHDRQRRSSRSVSGRLRWDELRRDKLRLGRLHMGTRVDRLDSYLGLVLSQDSAVTQQGLKADGI